MGFLKFRLSLRSSPSVIVGIVMQCQKCHNNKLILNFSLSLPQINIHFTPTLIQFYHRLVSSDTKH